MLEYVNENGESYTEDEINQFAKDNNTSFDDIIAKNGLTPKKQKENVSPGIVLVVLSSGQLSELSRFINLFCPFMGVGLG